MQRQLTLEQVDGAAVYVNAPTRFTDGGQFGLGFKIGISTPKTACQRSYGTERVDQL